MGSTAESTLSTVMVFRTRADARGPELSASEAVKDTVGHLVRQFADPLALFRELAQNSIDAGATKVDVRLRYDDAEDALAIAVHDDGHGMTLDTIERCLLVLFRSSKDKDPTKIGKFGVGFFSVFALGPRLVRVDTGTGPEGYRVELREDFSYEVTESPPSKGTSVTIVVPMRIGEARTFAQRAVVALERWCAHVAIPLHILSTVKGGEVDQRVDRPFGIDGDVTVARRVGPVTIAAAASATGARAAFYKRGMLLHECESMFDGASFKVDAPSLGHTVSRDNVRRDEAFSAVLSSVAQVIRGELVDATRAAAREALRSALAGSSSTGPGESAQKPARRHPADHAAALLTALVPLAAGAPLPLPLCAPTERFPDQIFEGDSSGLRLYSSSPDLLSRALARRDEPVLWTHALGVRHAAMLSAMLPQVATATLARYRAIAPSDGALDPEEELLLDQTRRLLRAVGIRHARLIEAAGVDRAFVAVDPEVLTNMTRDGTVIDAEDVGVKLFAFFGNRACAIVRTHADWQRAVSIARTDPVRTARAALAFVRIVLLDATALDRGNDLALFEAFCALA
jgi:hypothetical protein